MALSKMPLDFEDTLRELRGDVQDSKERHDAMNYDFIMETTDIKFLDFHNKNTEAMWAFELFMDLSPKRDLFANRLGLEYNDIMWCNTYCKTGPTQEVFKYLGRKNMLQNLTLFTVLNHLKDMELTAIFTLIKWEECIARCKATSLNSQEITEKMVHVQQKGEILVNSANVGAATANDEHTNCQMDSKAKSKRKFGAKVLLFFASDASEEALRVVEQLKTHRTEDGREIGVIILTAKPTAEVTNALLVDPWNSIHKWFKQVDFVVPILSRQLLRQIQVQDSDTSSLIEMQFNRYVYRLLLDDYVSNMSRNQKCRPLCSQEGMTEVRESELVKANGLLEMNWDCSPENVEMLAEILITGAKEKRNRAVIMQNRAVNS